jgi:hypothetical protein
MNIARSIVLCSAAVAIKRGKNADFSSVFSASKTLTIAEDIAYSARHQRCGSY